MVVLDAAGNGLYEPDRPAYPAAALAGSGALGGRTVRCISPEWVVRFHCAYAPAPKDVADVTAVCSRFGIPFPEAYARAVRGA